MSRVQRDDQGVALVVAIALIGLATVLMVTMTSLAIREHRESGRDRSRAVAVTSAEGAVDLALTKIQQASVAALPCSSQVTNSDARPDAVKITTTITYVDAVGTALACPPPATSVAAQALVRAVSVSVPGTGRLPVRRTVESLVQLKPKFSTDLNKAIFGNSGVTIGNHFTLNGNTGNDADVYTNGPFTCQGNEEFHGSVVTQKTATINQTCKIYVDIRAHDGVTMAGGTVLGDIQVSNGTATMSGGAVSGRVYAQAISPASWCSGANASKCSVGPTAAAAPTVESFPVLKGDDATILLWKNQGFVEQRKDGCTANDATNPAVWLLANASSLTSKTVLRTKCRFSVASNAKSVSLNQDVAIFADGGVEITNTFAFQSTTSAMRNLYFIHPQDFGTRVAYTCANLPASKSGNPTGVGVTLSQQVTIAGSVRDLVYSPCNVDKSNNGTLYGQVYGGGTVNMGNLSDLTFSPLPVFGATGSSVVVSYQADVLYKRENLS